MRNNKDGTMITDEKKVAAAMAAVSMYLEEEQITNVTAGITIRMSSTWAQNGREEIMRMNQMVTLRLAR